jgi:hypothetical protein
MYTMPAGPIARKIFYFWSEVLAAKRLNRDFNYLLKSPPQWFCRRDCSQKDLLKQGENTVLEKSEATRSRPREKYPRFSRGLSGFVYLGQTQKMQSRSEAGQGDFMRFFVAGR